MFVAPLQDLPLKALLLVSGGSIAAKYGEGQGVGRGPSCTPAPFQFFGISTLSTGGGVSASDIRATQKKTLSGAGTGFSADSGWGLRARVAASYFPKLVVVSRNATAPPNGICSLGGAALFTGPSNPQCRYVWGLEKRFKQKNRTGISGAFNLEVG
jgi:hypothetical protein